MTSPLPLSVQPGPATRLAPALSSGMFIRNNDGTNAVWISPDSNVVVGTGIKLNPLASTTWAAQQPCYAVVDTGVTAAVALTLTTSVMGLDDPVATATASAALLLQQGIPNVFQGTLLVNTLISTSGPHSYTVNADLSKYAGLCVNLFQIGPEQMVTLSWLDAPGGNVLTGQTYLATGSRMTGAGTGSNLKLMVAVKSPTLRIDFPLGSMTNFFGTQLIIYASNRLPVETVGNIDLGVDYTATQPFAANTPVFMGNLTTNGGVHQARCLTSSSGLGYFGYETYDPVGGAVKNIYLFRTTAGQDGFTQMVLPRGALSLYFLTALVATFTVEFSVVPGNG